MAPYSKDARDQAIGWFNRLQDPKLDEAGWQGFTVWLEAAPEHRYAYDAVEAVWLGFEPPSSSASAEVISLDSRRAKPAPMFRMPQAAAAALALAVLGVGGAGFLVTRPAPVETYRTAAAEVRTIDLKDGSRVVLDRASTLKVAFTRKHRRVELVSGEANFAVAHDASRPFVVMAGDQKIQDIGTEFDVLSQAQRLRVTVSHGMVAVGDATGGDPGYQLAAGDQFEQRRGQRGVVRRVEAATVPAWRNGVLVYQDAPLSDVAADLGRYLATPVKLGPGTEGMSFSGVLRISDGVSMIDRLEAFLSLHAERGPDGVVLTKTGG